MASPVTVVSKRSSACAACHMRKVRCDLKLHESTREQCSNCRDSGNSCLPYHRKRRRQDANAHESPLQSGPSPKVARLSTVDDYHTPSQGSYLGRSDYITAHGDIDEDDATKYRGPVPRTSTWHSFEAKVRRNMSSLDVPKGTLRQTFLRNFMLRCRPWMPLVSELDLERLEAKTEDTLLVTSMLVAGTIVSSTPQAAEQGQRCYQRAKLLFYTNAAQNHLHTIMATIFLQWLNPSGPEHVSIDNSSFWLRVSVSLAHQMGLHRETDHRMSDAKLRRRIWWALVSRDNQIAMSHGRPKAINADDSNVRPLRLEDFDGGDEDALLFIHFVQITCILGDLTECYRRSTLSDRMKIDFEDTLRRWLKTVPLSLRLYHPETKRLNQYNFKVRQLHSLYFVALIFLFRHEKREEPPSAVAIIAASFISGTFEEYLTNEDISHLSVTSIFYLMVTALLQLSYQRFPSLAAHRTQELEIVRLSLDELKKRFPSAAGAERVVNQMMKQSTSLPDNIASTRLVLTIEQKEFFAPFGPELCRMWTMVAEPQPGILDVISAYAAVNKPTAHTSTAQNNQQHQDRRVSHAGDSYSLSAWNDDGDDLTFAANDAELSFSNDQAMDSLGRWWWADWVPEADMEFLSKSL